MGCSGGDEAVDCFSTRLMWRGEGRGEMYLVSLLFFSLPLSFLFDFARALTLYSPQYAPKDKQTPTLCSLPPQSVCDATYGLSLARGSFTFKAGAWTHVRQTIRLNTPGEQDGGMVLEVDGKRVIERGDVYYRGVPPPPPPPSPPPPPALPSAQAKTKEGTKEKSSETTSVNKAKSTTSGPPGEWSGGTSGGKQDCGLLGLGCLQEREKVEVAPRREVVFEADAGAEGVDMTQTMATTRTVTATQSVEPDVITLVISEWKTVAPNATVAIMTKTITSTVTSTAIGATSTNVTYDAEEGSDGGDFVASEDDDGNVNADSDEESGVGFQGLFFRCVLCSAFLISVYVFDERTELTLCFVYIVRSLEDTTRVTRRRRISILGSRISG